MYPHQRERLLEALERARLDALVATSPANISYITGFRSLTEIVSPSRECAVFTREGTALVVPAIDVPAIVADAVDVDHVVCYGVLDAEIPAAGRLELRRLRAIVAGGAPAPAEALAGALARLGVSRGSIGLDESRLTHDTWLAITARLADATVVGGGAALASARRVKGPYEIECLANALRIAEEALDAVIQVVARGMTEREAATLFTTEVIKRGGWPSPPLIAVGERSAIPAPWPTDAAVRPGDLVRFDVGAVYRGYCGRVGRTAVLGESRTEQESTYQAVQAGLEAAIATVAAGAAAGGVFEAAVAAARAGGLAHRECPHVGHGLGLEPYEEPTLAAGDATRLELGLVLGIETSHYEMGSMGMAVKDTVLVTEAGARALNRSHHGLVVLD